MKMKKIILAAVSILALTATAFAGEGRPGIVRSDDKCYKTTDFLDLGPEVPCDDRYADAEKIAWDDLSMQIFKNGTASDKVWWQAWQAATGNTHDERMTSFKQEKRKLAAPYAALSDQYLAPCIDASSKGGYTCEDFVADFRLEYWSAMQGDDFPQQELADCFKHDSNYRNEPPLCGGMVMKNRIMECAWRLIRISSGNPKITPNDADSYDDYCGDQSWAEKQATLAQATRLFPLIYHRPLPLARR